MTTDFRGEDMAKPAPGIKACLAPGDSRVKVLPTLYDLGVPFLGLSMWLRLGLEGFELPGLPAGPLSTCSFLLLGGLVMPSASVQNGVPPKPNAQRPGCCVLGPALRASGSIPGTGHGSGPF